jgi:hypothetical protein
MQDEPPEPATAPKAVRGLAAFAGHKMPIGDVARVYVKCSTTDNGMPICREETMKACFSMKRVRDL